MRRFCILVRSEKLCGIRFDFDGLISGFGNRWQFFVQIVNVTNRNFYGEIQALPGRPRLHWSFPDTSKASDFDNRSLIVMRLDKGVSVNCEHKTTSNAVLFRHNLIFKSHMKSKTMSNQKGFGIHYSMMTRGRSIWMIW